LLKTEKHSPGSEARTLILVVDIVLYNAQHLLNEQRPFMDVEERNVNFLWRVVRKTELKDRDERRGSFNLARSA
jgi:hypothetical protein